mmetsp:Transcript_15229/g.25439  ORF Transcript_15229/g.25439 Transcript_15229/m.25439 type:complete len:234 (+) Transcript_15229:393-1094(+)
MHDHALITGNTLYLNPRPPTFARYMIRRHMGNARHKHCRRPQAAASMLSTRPARNTQDGFMPHHSATARYRPLPGGASRAAQQARRPRLLHLRSRWRAPRAPLHGVQSQALDFALDDAQSHRAHQCCSQGPRHTCGDTRHQGGRGTDRDDDSDDTRDHHRICSVCDSASNHHHRPYLLGALDLAASARQSASVPLRQQVCTRSDSPMQLSSNPRQSRTSHANCNTGHRHKWFL